MSHNDKSAGAGDYPFDSRDAATSGATVTPPGGQPVASGAHGHLHVVWSQPQTGSGWQSAFQSRTDQAPDDARPANSTLAARHIVAFESDLFDNAFVHWNHERPTLEMIQGHKKDSPVQPDSWPAESLMSGAAAMLEPASPTISPVLPGTDSLDGTVPFDPDISQGTSGPAAVRKDGIEDPRRGWRPTGLVFFETMTTSPREVVYSTTMLDAFNEFSRRKAADNHPPAEPEIDDPSTLHPLDDAASSDPLQAGTFFDYNEDPLHTVVEIDDELPLQEVVVKGGRGSGGSGTFIIKLIGKLFLLGIVMAVLASITLVVMYGWYAKQRLYDGQPGGGREFVVTIAPGDDFRTIINGMHEDGMLASFMGLDDRYLMRYLAHFYENSHQIKPGVHRFSSGQKLDDVYRKLVEGSKDYKITIPEGKTAAEVGDLLARQFKGFDAAYFNQLVNDPEFVQSLNIDAPSLEGYLYPSTYYFGPGMKEEELIKLMVATFHNKMESIQDQISTGTLSLHEHIIMASLIEREARVNEDRPLIASVILNRINQGMPLQIDATVNYALNDWRRLTHADYRTDHPYNTYKIKGLPPGPITSPRIESILATFTAPDTNYLYYVHKGDGHHAFAETYAQHQANVGRYIRERHTRAAMGNADAPEGRVASRELAGPVTIETAEEENPGPIIIYPEGVEPETQDEERSAKEPATSHDISIEIDQTPAPKSY